MVRHNCQDEVVVYNQDTNLLLEHAMDVHAGKKRSPLESLGDGTALPNMPRPGDVDLIMGGPPCQSFSGMNHFKVSLPSCPQLDDQSLIMGNCNRKLTISGEGHME